MSETLVNEKVIFSFMLALPDGRAFRQEFEYPAPDWTTIAAPSAAEIVSWTPDDLMWICRDRSGQTMNYALPIERNFFRTWLSRTAAEIVQQNGPKQSP